MTRQCAGMVGASGNGPTRDKDGQPCQRRDGQGGGRQVEFKLQPCRRAALVLTDRDLVEVVGRLAGGLGIVVLDRAVQVRHLGQAKDGFEAVQQQRVAGGVSARSRGAGRGGAGHPRRPAGPPGSSPADPPAAPLRPGRRQPHPRAAPAGTGGSGGAHGSARVVSPGPGYPPAPGSNSPSRRLNAVSIVASTDGRRRRGRWARSAAPSCAVQRAETGPAPATGGRWSPAPRAAGRYRPAAGRRATARVAPPRRTRRQAIRTAPHCRRGRGSGSSVAGNSTVAPSKRGAASFSVAPRPRRCRRPRRWPEATAPAAISRTPPTAQGTEHHAEADTHILQPHHGIRVVRPLWRRQRGNAIADRRLPPVRRAGPCG